MASYFSFLRDFDFDVSDKLDPIQVGPDEILIILAVKANLERFANVLAFFVEYRGLLLLQFAPVKIITR